MRRGANDECWEWLGTKLRGYGRFHLSPAQHEYKTSFAHRVAWELTNGKITDGLIVRHKCRGKCVNPNHLELGTHWDNAKDKYRDGTTTKKIAVEIQAMETKMLESLTASVSVKTGAPITESTARNYVRYVKNLYLKIHPGTEMKTLAWIKSWETVEPAVNSYAESTQVSVLNAVCAVLRRMRGYKSVLKRYEAELASRVGRNRAAATEEKDEKQKDYWMEWDAILAKRDALPEGIDKVLLSLYTMIPPGRAQEYATMMVGDGENSYDPERGVMRIRKHKTAREFPDEIIQVPAELKAVLDRWLDGRTSGSLLGLPSPGAVTKRLNKVFAPKKISVSALRHIYDTHHHGKAVEALKADARAMRHSVGTAMRTYIRA